MVVERDDRAPRVQLKLTLDVPEWLVLMIVAVLARVL